MDQEVSRTLDDIERRLEQLEVELAATAPARLTELAATGRARLTEPAGDADNAAPPSAAPIDRADQAPDGDRGDAVIIWDEHAGGPVPASAAGVDNGAAVPHDSAAATEFGESAASPFPPASFSSSPRPSSAPADELAGARERVEQIADELLRDYDELLRFRSRLEQAKGDLIQDYKRLLESRDTTRSVNS